MRDTLHGTHLEDSDTGAKFRHLAFSALVVAFFVGVIVYYASRLYRYERAHIAMDGKFAAAQTSERLGEYLSKSMNVIMFIGGAVDTLIQKGKTNEEILAFLAEQDAPIKKRFITDTTGLYACVRGKYLDPSWTPPDDYAPTTRPWYLQAVANGPRLTIIDPYLDANTKEMVMTVAHGMRDGQSVLAMDLSMKTIQKVVEEAVGKGDADKDGADKGGPGMGMGGPGPGMGAPGGPGMDKGGPGTGMGGPDGPGMMGMGPPGMGKPGAGKPPVNKGDVKYEFIVDKNDTAVAHSEQGEVGQNYAKKRDSLWGRIVAKARAAPQAEYVELTYQGRDYLTFFTPLPNGWMCLCVKDASSVLGPLRQELALTVLVVSVCIIVLLHILGQSQKRYRTASHLNKQLSTLANICIAVYDIDLDNDRYAPIKGYDPIENMSVTHPSARAMLEAITGRFADPAAASDLHRFLDLGTLGERLEDTESIAFEFLNLAKRWLRLRFIVGRRHALGAPSRVLLLAEDIDKEKKERDQLRDLSEKAVAASEAKSSFLSNMSHEIRTPINAILGMNEMILRESSEDGTLAYAENVKSAGHTLLGLINDILDFSKIEAGKIEIIPVEYALSSLLNDLVTMTQTRARAKGLELELDFNPETPGRLFGDEIRVKQVITNILTNAVKYTEKGKVSFSVGFRVPRDDPNAVTLTVAVKDTGIGIKPEDIQRLFSEFERVDEKRNRAIEGTGLGMAITKRLLGLMGTELKVESVYGAGSTFSFALRQEVVDWAPLGEFQPAADAFLKEREVYHEKFTAPDARVLVADDNPMNLVVFQNLLKQTQVQIDVANDGDEALELARDTKYDILFLDHMMPGKDGIETLHALRAKPDALNAETPAICLTANAIAGARDQYIKAGFDDYLTKPVDGAKLEATLQAHLPKDKIKAAKAKQGAPTDGMTIAALIAKLRGQDWIDVSLGLQNSGSAKEYLPLLKIFYESLDEKAAEIERFHASGDLKNYTIKVHALKSSARLIGAAAFGEEAQELENAGKREDKEYIAAHHQAFMAKLHSFKAPLAEVLAEKVDDRPEADPSLMVDVYEEMRAAATDMDSDRLDAILAEMAAYTIPDDGEGRWERLTAAAKRFDYEAILQLLPPGGE